MSASKSVHFSPDAAPPAALIPRPFNRSRVCLLVLSVPQLALSVGLLCQNVLLLLTVHSSAFHHEASRVTIQFVVAINLCWAASVTLLLVGLVRESARLVLPHFCLSFLLLPYNCAYVLLLIVTHSFATSIANAAVSLLAVCAAMPLEWQLLAGMRRRAGNNDWK